MRMACTLLSACALTACVDLGAVRDYAKNSGNALTVSEAIFSVSTTTYDHAHQVAQLPIMRGSNGDFLAQLNADAAASKSFSPLNKSASQVLHLYFSTLAAAADDGLVDPSAQAKSIDDSLVKLKIESSDGKGLAAKGAASSIINALVRIPLEFARQSAVRELILASNDDIQVLTRYLAESAAFVGNRRLDVGNALDTYYRVSFDAGRDPAARAVVLDRKWDEQTAAAADEATAKKAVTALRTIGKDHQTLFDNAQHLSAASVKSTLTGDAPLIAAVVNLFLSK